MNEAIRNLKTGLIVGMTRYMKYGGAESESDPNYAPDFEAGYEQAHIDRCSAILDAFLGSLDSGTPPLGGETIMTAVKSAVIALNEVNADCGGAMIETDQREQICEIIIAAARSAGLVSGTYDITEAWRDW